MEKYLVIIEKANGNYSAYSPDVLGCAATGSTVEEATNNIKEALQFHLEFSEEIPLPKGLKEHISDMDLIINEDCFITELEIQTPQFA